MTDAQSFYLLLLAFYLFECLSFAPGGARAFVGFGGKDSRWRKREPAFRFGGANKDIFCTPIVPGSGMLTVFPQHRPLPKTLSPHAVRHLQKRTALLAMITRPLHRLGCIVFLHYFLILPYFYIFHLHSIWLIVLIILGELLSIVTAVHFYHIHRRLLPELKGERRLETFFNAFFPWHAMRASDLIIKRTTSEWHPLVMLASAPRHRKNLGDLCRLWRLAHYRGDAGTLDQILNQAGIDSSAWDAPPPHEPTQRFCPVCHAIYEPGPEVCADCHEVQLSKPHPGIS